MSIAVSFFGFVMLMVFMVMFKKSIKKAVDIVDTTLEEANNGVKSFAVEAAIERSRDFKKNHPEIKDEDIVDINELYKKIKNR